MEATTVIEYAHCVVPDSPGKTDGRYQNREAEVYFFRLSGEKGSDEGSFAVEGLDGRLIASDRDSKVEALFQAQYRLMVESRNAAMRGRAA